MTSFFPSGLSQTGLVPSYDHVVIGSPSIFYEMPYSTQRFYALHQVTLIFWSILFVFHAYYSVTVDTLFYSSSFF